MIDRTTAKEKGEYVQIPEVDIYELPFPKVRINQMEFLPGETYKLPTEIATEVKRILKSKAESDIRLMRPRKDKRTVAQVQNSSSSGIVIET